MSDEPIETPQPPAPTPQEIVKRILAGEHVELDPRQRMAIDRVAMPEEDATARAADFREVNLGLTEQLAFLEAERCLQCKNPTCIAGCPVRVNIPRFIERLRDGDVQGAAHSLLDDNALPCVTGRVCPQ
jgi:glutamate synthase (NADPH/NADH) small chain